MSKLKDSVNFFANLIFPQHCLLCKKESRWYLCDDCQKSISIYSQNRCSVCSKPVLDTKDRVVCPICLSRKRYFEKGFSLFNYEDENIKKMIEFIKFYEYPYLVRILFNFEDFIKSLDIFSNVDFLIPVPMHKKDIAKRGYNQSVFIAKTLSAITNIPVCYDMLIKVRKTEKQVGLNYNERTKNLSGAFAVKQTKSAGRIVLIDDVFTTGSTINECAKTLKSSGVLSNFFTFATTPSS